MLPFVSILSATARKILFVVGLLVGGVFRFVFRRLPHVLPRALVRAKTRSDSAVKIPPARLEFAPPMFNRRMSIRATNFVRGLRGLSPSEKAVAFVLADHDDHRGGRGSFPSMSTVAEESGLQDRETASRITKRLAGFGIIGADNNKTSRGRKPTVYRFNFDVSNRDFRITVETPLNVIPESQFAPSNSDSDPRPTVTHNVPNRDAPITGRVLEGVEGPCSLVQLAQGNCSRSEEHPILN